MPLAEKLWTFVTRPKPKVLKLASDCAVGTAAEPVLLPSKVSLAIVGRSTLTVGPVAFVTVIVPPVLVTSETLPELVDGA